MSLEIRLLTPNDIILVNALLTTFSEAFEDKETYSVNRPSDRYLQDILSNDTFMAIAALKSNEVVGGLTAYELKKPEQPRSEIYIYDLAVASQHRREGIATALINKLKKIAAERGAYVIFVQADTTPEDEPAIALYSKLGKREDVLHFDIAVNSTDLASFND